MSKDIRKLGFNILLAVGFYLPLEDFILSWVPAPMPVVLVLRQMPEILIWIVTLGVCGLHLAKHGTIKLIGQKTDRFLMGFLAVAAIGIVLNGADPYLAVLGLKALVRFIMLVYALLILAPEPEDMRRAPKLVLIAVGIQIVIGMAEWLVGQPARSFFSVVNVWGGFTLSANVELIRHWESYDITGTLARSVGFAYFILVGYIIWLVQTNGKRVAYSLGVALTLLVTYQAHSRMAVFATVLMLVGHQISIRGIRQTSVLLILSCPLVALLMFSLGSDFLSGDFLSAVVDEEYQQRAQRLGLVVYMLPNVFDGGITLFGHSGELELVAAAVERHFDLPPFVANVFTLVVEDVYWLALLLYYGFIGFGLFVVFVGKNIAIQARLFKNAKDPEVRYYAQIALLLLILAIPLNLVNQTFEIRTFSYYLWLFVGLAIVRAEWSLRQESTIEAGLTE